MIENAKITSTFLGREDHGILTGMVTLAGDGWGVGFGGRCLGGDYTTEWIKGVLDTLEVSSWEKLPGTLVRVEWEGVGGRALRIGHAIKNKWYSGEKEKP